nr:MAG TPA: hypothetical protein [Caudoviricetes sp.]DAS29058.1 MAG TPA: hypothetical protein [Caudoviricetes sp.]
MSLQSVHFFVLSRDDLGCFVFRCGNGTNK